MTEYPIRPQSTNFRNDTGMAGGDGETGINGKQELRAVAGEDDVVTEEGMEELELEELEAVKTSEVPRHSAVDNVRIPKSLTSPIRPPDGEVAKHELTHMPYRPWCRVCVEARGKEDPHKQKKRDPDDESGLPIVSLDYQEMNEKLMLRLLVGKDEATGCVLAHSAVCKGPRDEWLMRRIVNDLRELGRPDIILKTDGEPAIVAVQEDVQSRRPGRTIPRNPPAYNPEANGACEKAVQDVTAQVRTLKIALQYRIKAEVTEADPVMHWMIEHACFIINRYSVGQDGMTPFERLTGRKWNRPLVEFGEVVQAKLALRRRQQGAARKQKMKLSHRSIAATWVGQVGRTGEHIVIKKDGQAVRCRTIRRVPVEHRWSAERVRGVIAVPRRPSPNSTDPEKIEARMAAEEQEADRDDLEADPEAEDPEEKTVVRREMRITDRILEAHGFTPGCPGCEARLGGPSTHRGHTAECRQRIYDEMAKEERGRDKLEEVKQRLVRTERVDASLEEPNSAQVKRRRLVSSEADKEPADDAPMGGDAAAEAEPGDRPEADPDDIPELSSEIDDGDGGVDMDVDMDGAELFAPSDDEPNNPTGAEDEDMVTTEDKQQSLSAVIDTVKNTLNGRTKFDLNAFTRVKHDIKRMLEDLEQAEPENTKALDDPRSTPAKESKMDVAEAYSPPRLVRMACKRGLRGGWSLDLTMIDPDDGKPWDLSLGAKRRKVMEMIKRDKPMLLIVSPMCGAFSALQELFNYPRMHKTEVMAKLKDGLSHLKFAMELCVMQHNAGRLFMFEHPETASSWSTKTVKNLAAVQGVYKVAFDFCMMGMTAPGPDGKQHPAKKRTGILTNSQAIASALRRAQCNGQHTHVPLLGGLAGPCQIYPDKFCRLVCDGLKEELARSRWRNQMAKTYDVTGQFGELLRVEELQTVPEEVPDLTHLYDGQDFVDDVSGMPLDKKQAIKARILEMEFFRKKGVYTKVRREPWMTVITTKWIDQNKGDSSNPNYRARLVGREIAYDKREDLFAATPPLESLRIIISRCASNQGARKPEDRFIIMSNDVKRAYFEAPTNREIYIHIPREDKQEGDEGMVGKLNLSLYGTRDAAQNWAKAYTDFLVSIGYMKGTASPCNFYHPIRDISTTVHGDDFTSTGSEAALRWLDGQLRSRFDMKTELLGPGEKHAKEIRVLNRVLTWTELGIKYEADQRHAEIIIGEMGVTKSVATPGTREDANKAGPPNSTAKGLISKKAVQVHDEQGKEVYRMRDRVQHDQNGWQVEKHADEENEPLGSEEARQYRGLAARANYLAQDRPDIQYAVKEISRRMSSPSKQDWHLLKRLARYLAGCPRAVLTYHWQESSGQSLEVHTDSDWAGCKSTSRSTSGGSVQLGWHFIKSWSSTQAVVALSSAEAELYALVKGAAQTLGMISVARDLGIKVDAMIRSDASAALGIVSREGLGKLRHIDVQYLWIQGRVSEGSVSVMKVPGLQNPADLFTKHLHANDVEKFCQDLCLTRHDDRADTAPTLCQLIGGDLAASDLLNSIEFRDDKAKKDAAEEIKQKGYLQLDNGTVAIVHEKPRKELFLPSRHEGVAPRKAFTGHRETHGRYADTGEKFVHRDTWSRAKILCLDRRWTGWTCFSTAS